MGVVCDAPSIFEVVLRFHEMAVHMVRETLRTKNLIILESHPTDSKLGTCTMELFINVLDIQETINR